MPLDWRTVEDHQGGLLDASASSFLLCGEDSSDETQEQRARDFGWLYCGFAFKITLTN